MTTPRTAAGRELYEARDDGTWRDWSRVDVWDGICNIESEAATAALESRIEAVADLIHETCVAEWERRAARHPGRALTLHGPDAHHAEVRVALGLVGGTE